MRQWLSGCLASIAPVVGRPPGREEHFLNASVPAAFLNQLAKQAPEQRTTGRSRQDADGLIHDVVDTYLEQDRDWTGSPSQCSGMSRTLVVALAFAPVALMLFCQSRNHGASVVRPLSSLLLIWPAWFLASIDSEAVPFVRISLWLTVILGAIGAWFLGWRRGLSPGSPVPPGNLRSHLSHLLCPVHLVPRVWTGNLGPGKAVRSGDAVVIHARGTDAAAGCLAGWRDDQLLLPWIPGPWRIREAGGHDSRGNLQSRTRDALRADRDGHRRCRDQRVRPMANEAHGDRCWRIGQRLCGDPGEPLVGTRGAQASGPGSGTRCPFPDRPTPL